jgi:O-methyltransferase involved in polyketide biosynthesis
VIARGPTASPSSSAEPAAGTPGADPGLASGTPPTPGATLAATVAAIGEPWITFYEPHEIERKLRHAGFSDVELVTPAIAEQRYFAGRPDGLPSPRRASIISATV